MKNTVLMRFNGKQNQQKQEKRARKTLYDIRGKRQPKRQQRQAGQQKNSDPFQHGSSGMFSLCL